MVAEFLGTFFLVVIGTGVAIEATLSQSIAGSPVDSLAVALAFGLTLVVLVNAFGHTSGAHFNPAVTLSLAIVGKMPWRSVVPYIAAQIVGATTASAALLAVFGPAVQAKTHLAATYPGAGISTIMALIIELVATFLLMLVIMSVATDDRADSATTGLSIGLALCVGVLVTGALTGGALNPARALGPMIVAGKFTAFWIYIVGPVIGATLAAIVYDKIIKAAVTPEA